MDQILSPTVRVNIFCVCETIFQTFDLDWLDVCFWVIQVHIQNKLINVLYYLVHIN